MLQKEVWWLCNSAHVLTMPCFALRNLMIPLVEVDEFSPIHFANHIIYKWSIVCLTVWACQFELESSVRLLLRV